MQVLPLSPVVGVGKVGGNGAGTVLPGGLQPVGRAYAFRFRQAGQAEQGFEKEDVVLLVAHGGIGVVQIMLRQAIDQAEGDGIHCRPLQQPAYGGRQRLGQRMGEEGEEVHEALLHEQAVAAAEGITEIHPVPEVFQHVGRPFFGGGEQSRNFRQGQLTGRALQGIGRGVVPSMSGPLPSVETVATAANDTNDANNANDGNCRHRNPK